MLLKVSEGPALLLPSLRYGSAEHEWYTAQATGDSLHPNEFIDHARECSGNIKLL